MQLLSISSFRTILPSDLIQRLAVKHSVDKCNQIRLPGLAVFTCLLDSVLSGGCASQRALEDAYYNNTGNTADHSSFGKRLAKIPVGLFKDIFEHLYQELTPQAAPNEIKALRVRFVDATIVTLSARLIKFGLSVSHTRNKETGTGRRDVKAVFSLEENGLPRVMRLCSEPSEHSDNVALGEPILAELRPNDLYVVDAGLSDRDRLFTIDDKKAYFLTRHSSQRLNVGRVVFEAAQSQINDDAPGKDEATYQLVRVEDCRFGNDDARDTKKFAGLDLLAIHGRRWDSRSSKWTPLVLITNLPLSEDDTKAGPYSFTDVAELYRQRWDIEQFFKFIKQNLGYSHILSRTQNGIEVMIYMTLIATLLMIWYKKLAGIKNGWPSVRRWLAWDTESWIPELIDAAIWEQVAARKNRPRRM
ncbi:MAG: IS4 family transposase [Candidatus Pacebacteria bacterium]|nr:IS4 family transposase [Candidatus Paceibacterota bacterium]